MFEIGFSKLLLIGVVALIVIGPEKLPRVARTAGALLSRAQRYISDIKSEVAQQVNVDELNEMKKDVEEAARKMESSLKNAESSLKKEVKEFESSVEKNVSDTTKELEKVWKPSEQGDIASLAADSSEEVAPVAYVPGAEDADSDWRMAFNNTSLLPKDTNKESVELNQPAIKEVHTATFERSKEVGSSGQAQWRAQRTATPLWYKRKVRTRAALRSSAARGER